MARNRNAHPTARATSGHPQHVPTLGLVLFVLVASVLALLPAWLGALLGLPLD